MMLEQITKYIADRIRETNQLAQVNDIAELVMESSTNPDMRKIYPAIYHNKDNLKEISRTDYTAGVAFFLRTQPDRLTDIEGKRGCEPYTRAVYSVALYYMFKRTSQQQVDLLTNCIRNKAYLKNPTDLRESLTLTTINITSATLSTDTSRNAGEIWQGIDLRLNYDFVLHKLELNYTAQYYSNCITTCCP